MVMPVIMLPIMNPYETIMNQKPPLTFVETSNPLQCYAIHTNQEITNDNEEYKFVVMLLLLRKLFEWFSASDPVYL